MDKNLKAQLDAYLAENFFEEELVAEDSPKTLSFCLARKINFDKIFKENEGETFSEMMIRLVAESGEKNSAVYNRAQIDKQLFSRIKKNKDYHPSKDTAVALAVALKLDFSKAKDFLATAGYTFAKSKRDLIIKFFIENEIFDMNLLNLYLHEYNQPVMFSR